MQFPLCYKIFFITIIELPLHIKLMPYCIIIILFFVRIICKSEKLVVSDMNIAIRIYKIFIYT